MQPIAVSSPERGLQVTNLGLLQTYYKNAYALIRPACPACFVAISPRVNEEVRMFAAMLMVSLHNHARVFDECVHDGHRPRSKSTVIMLALGANCRGFGLAVCEQMRLSPRDAILRGMLAVCYKLHGITRTLFCYVPCHECCS